MPDGARREVRRRRGARPGSSALLAPWACVQVGRRQAMGAQGARRVARGCPAIPRPVSVRIDVWRALPKGCPKRVDSRARTPTRPRRRQRRQGRAGRPDRSRLGRRRPGGRPLRRQARQDAQGTRPDRRHGRADLIGRKQWRRPSSSSKGWGRRAVLRGIREDRRHHVRPDAHRLGRFPHVCNRLGRIAARRGGRPRREGDRGRNRRVRHRRYGRCR